MHANDAAGSTAPVRLMSTPWQMIGAGRNALRSRHPFT